MSDSTLSFVLPEEQPRWPIATLFRSFVPPHRRLLVIAIFASVLYPLLSLLPIYLLQTAIDAILLATEPFVLPGVPSDQLPVTPFVQLIVVALLMLLATLGAAVLGAISTLAWGRFAQDVQHRLRVDTYEHVQSTNLLRIESIQTGQLLSILNDDVSNLNRLLESFLKDILETVVRLLGIAGILFLLHWQLAIAAITVIPIMALVGRYFARRIRPRYAAVRNRIGVLNSRFENNLSGLLVIKSNAAEEFETARVTNASNALYAAQWSVIRAQAAFFPTMSAINWIAFSGLLIGGGYWYLIGPPGPATLDISVGILVSFLLYNQQLTTPLIHATRLVDLYFEARASIERILALREQSSASPTATNSQRPAVTDGSIELTDVWFTYPNATVPTIRDVSFHVTAGETIGLVGQTGSGKTTIAKLLLAFGTPDSGQLTVDNRPIDTVDPTMLRSHIAIVSQDPYLFSGTVRANVAYGDTEFSEAAIISALKTAQAWSFVRRLPEGLDTHIGQRGVTLSGGQRQRIAIARALVSDPTILVLDEAMSHVDNDHAAALRNALFHADHARTTIVIAHRLAAVRHADRIIVFDDGTIVESGSHENLVDARGVYAGLWALQGGTPPIPET